MKPHLRIFALVLILALLPTGFGFFAKTDDFESDLTGEEIYVGPRDATNQKKGHVESNLDLEDEFIEGPNDEHIYALKATIYFLRDDLKNIKNYFPNMNVTPPIQPARPSHGSLGSELNDDYGDDYMDDNNGDLHDDIGEEQGGHFGDEDLEEDDDNDDDIEDLQGSHGHHGSVDDYDDYNDFDPSLTSDYDDEPLQPQDKPLVEFADITVPSVLGGAGADETAYQTGYDEYESFKPTKPPKRKHKPSKPNKRRPQNSQRPQNMQRPQRRPGPQRRPNRNKRPIRNRNRRKNRFASKFNHRFVDRPLNFRKNRFRNNNRRNWVQRNRWN